MDNPFIFYSLTICWVIRMLENGDFLQEHHSYWSKCFLSTRIFKNIMEFFIITNMFHSSSTKLMTLVSNLTSYETSAVSVNWFYLRICWCHTLINTLWWIFVYSYNPNDEQDINVFWLAQPATCKSYYHFSDW